MKKLLCIIALSFLTTLLNAQPRYQFITFDIDNRPNQASEPAMFTLFKNKVYFYATTVDGRELCCYDGNAVNIVADIAAGTGHGTPWIMNCNMVASNDFLYFAAGNASTGHELYRYDGNNPPALLHDINPGTANSYPYCNFIHNNKLYITAYISTFTYLYELDLTNNNLTLLTGIPGNQFNIADTGVALYNGLLYFAGNNGSSGNELCSYDPASGTFNLVSNIEPGGGSSMPRLFEVSGGKLYFIADKSADGTDLYVYDGSSVQNLTGTISPGYKSSINSTARKPFTTYKNEIYFSADNGTALYTLYAYNPTNGSTSAKINLGGSVAHSLIVYNNHLLYNSGTHHLYDSGSYHTPLKFVSNNIKSDAMGYPTIINNQLFYAGTFLNRTGADFELCILYDSTVSIQPIQTQPLSITLYPNPAIDNVYLDINLKKAQTFTVGLTDMQGRSIYQTAAKLYSEGQHKLIIPVQQLADGMYIYKLSDEKNSLLYSGKLLKQ